MFPDIVYCYEYSPGIMDYKNDTKLLARIKKER